MISKYTAVAIISVIHLMFRISAQGFRTVHLHLLEILTIIGVVLSLIGIVATTACDLATVQVSLSQNSIDL